MDWKAEAAGKLKEYAARRQSLEVLRLELSRAKLALERAKESANQDAELDAAAQVGELRYRLNDARLWAASMDKALEVLNEDERLTLTLSFIEPTKDKVARLCAALDMPRDELYQYRDAVLRRFTLAFYGISEG